MKLRCPPTALCCALVLALTQLGLGTSVLLVQTEDNSIYIGADALQTETATGKRSKICKVRKLSGNSYWAAASKFYRTDAGFSLEDIVASIGSEGTIDSKMSRFIDAVSEPLKGQVALLEAADHREYASFIVRSAARKVSPLEIAFIGFEGGKPKWALARFYVNKTQGKLALEVKREDKGKPTDMTFAVGLGDSRSSVDYVIRDLKRFYSNETKTMLDALDGVADLDKHKTVEGPYCVLKIDKPALWRVARD